VPPAARKLERHFYRLLLQDRLLWRGLPSQSPRLGRKQACVDALHAARGFDRPCTPEQLPSLDAEGLTRASLLDATDGLRRSVVIRGFARDVPAVQRWTRASLRARLEGHRCTVLRWDQDTDSREWDLGAKYQELAFSEFFDRMASERMYLNTSPELVTACPDLTDDLDLPRLASLVSTPGATWDEFYFLNFFIGARHVHSELHAAPGGNFFLNLVGRKRWTMLDPRLSAWVHPASKPPFQYFRSAYGGFRAQARRGLGPDDPLLRLPRMEVTLEPGDLLYNGPWWWHEVENLDDFTVGCAVRHIPPPLRASPSWSNQPVLTGASMYPVVRAFSFFHWLRHRLTGYATPIRDLLHPLSPAAIQRYLTRAE